MLAEYYRVVRVLVRYDMVFRALVWYAGWLRHTYSRMGLLSGNRLGCWPSITG